VSRANHRHDRVAFAWRLIAHRKTRSAVAISGIAFSILVVFVQLGFYGAVVNTALAISSRLDADIVLLSSRFVHMSHASTFPRARIFQALALPEVASSTPMYLRLARWEEPARGGRCKLFAIGFPLRDGVPLLVAGVSEQLRALEASNALLIDRLTQSKCRPLAEGGDVVVRDKAAHIVGDFEIGVGFLADGSTLMSDDTFMRLFAREDSLDRVYLGILKLEAGADAEEVAIRLRGILPQDTRVVTRGELDALLERHWIESTAVGNIFGMGTVVGFWVGVVVLYQVLSADVRTQLPFYATLKAMGYGDRRLYRFVLQQAWSFALLAFVPAFAVSAICFPLIRGLTYLPVYMTATLAISAFAMSVGMCTLAGLMSLRRISVMDPAELF